jgi:hypothetical protein
VPVALMVVAPNLSHFMKNESTVVEAVMVMLIT